MFEDQPTWLDDVGKLLANAHEEYLLEELFCPSFGDSKCPRSPVDIATVFPDWLDTPLEEVHGVLDRQRPEWKAVENLPEWLDGDNVRFQEGQSILV